MSTGRLSGSEFDEKALVESNWADRQDGLGSRLLGRRKECGLLRELVATVRAGRSSALALVGAPGIGKSALLNYVEAVATGCLVVRVAGVESQRELAFAGIHELCEPLMGSVDRLPIPQREALTVALGLAAGAPPDRLRVGLAVMTLLSERAREQPLICLVDDAQWLDRCSAQALTFVARRLKGQPVGLILAVCPDVADGMRPGLPELRLAGLPDPDAASLLESAVKGRLDPRVRDRIVAETGGNPAALNEMRRWFSPAELRFGLDPFGAQSRLSSDEARFARELHALPDSCRRLLVLAAAEPLGDVTLLRSAAKRVGVTLEDATPAVTAGLIELRERVWFRHPLLRSVAYRSAPLAERQLAHRAIADASDPSVDPERRAWHAGQGAAGPDESIAVALERSAVSAVAHGGLAAAAAFLERAASLTPDPANRVRRRLDTAGTMLHAGSVQAGQRALTLAELDPLTERQRAQLEVLRARIELFSGHSPRALRMLVAAAHHSEAVDPELALDGYLDAASATLLAGRSASVPGPVEVGHAARRALTTTCPRPRDLLLDAVASRFADGYPTAVPLMRGAVAAFEASELTPEEGLRHIWLAGVVASELWDDRGWDHITAKHLQLVRRDGAFGVMPTALTARAHVALFAGDLPGAAALVEEVDDSSETAGAELAQYAALVLAAFRGDADDALSRAEAAIHGATGRGEGFGIAHSNWALSVLFNGLRRYPEATATARAAADHPHDMGVRNWALAELIESALRVGESATARVASQELSSLAVATGTDWALGVAARCRAQLLPMDQAEPMYREAVERLQSTGAAAEGARAELLFGEWLRRAGRRREAREHLHIAHDELSAMHMNAFAERALHELAATGETVRKRTTGSWRRLTAQELHIARLAADGLTNPEIAVELYISPRTVEWHLRKVFAKLGITARRHLRESLKDAIF